MTRTLFWKLFLIIGAGVVCLFYIIDMAIAQIEYDMSLIAQPDREQLQQWSEQAEALYIENNINQLQAWLDELQHRENTWAAVARADISHIAGSTARYDDYSGFNMGRSVDWKIHLYFDYNPIMELPFSDGKTSLLVQLPVRMRPGSLWNITRIALQVVLPLAILILLSLVLYRHIMIPLKRLESATRAFTTGQFQVRVRQQLGNRDDELAQLSETFDKMADHIGELILRQRQLITDLSHELRTPLSRLDIALENLTVTQDNNVRSNERVARIQRESRHIRKLVDDTLSLSWLENERPAMRSESLDLVDLIHVLTEDGKFEYPDRNIEVSMPEAALISNSNHRMLGQAIENILRNALRYTPAGGTVTIAMRQLTAHYEITIADEGPGVAEQFLEMIFRPFFRVDTSRPADGNSFGLGLALARRQLQTIDATVTARNIATGGLIMAVVVPRQ
ncbi:HAMP domain-containing sensor histidine kinase [Planctobacterium marinum]|uniref:HAMP domain-containing sensor histidine kinase n=1 Tax=Planctobacterium marinum TaxID=1631968 RepID=UPI001E4CA218|nr:histidine kinase sensor domain-containing protein [Planctobacterium marinum]MCC2608212.1 histidine kinase sensor domain-containing protein [Planctobacterium marinum]